MCFVRAKQAAQLVVCWRCGRLHVILVHRPTFVRASSGFSQGILNARGKPMKATKPWRDASIPSFKEVVLKEPQGAERPATEPLVSAPEVRLRCVSWPIGGKINVQRYPRFTDRHLAENADGHPNLIQLPRGKSPTTRGNRPLRAAPYRA